MQTVKILVIVMPSLVAGEVAIVMDQCSREIDLLTVSWVNFNVI